MATILDLSHAVVDGMVTYPGLPGPVITEHRSREASRGRYAPGVEFQILHAVPPAVRGMGTCTVRAFAVLDPSGGPATRDSVA